MERPHRLRAEVVAVNVRQQYELQKRGKGPDALRGESAVNQDFIFHDNGIPCAAGANHGEVNHNRSPNPILT